MGSRSASVYRPVPLPTSVRLPGLAPLSARAPFPYASPGAARGPSHRVSSSAADDRHRPAAALRDRTALPPCADATSLPRWEQPSACKRHHCTKSRGRHRSGHVDEHEELVATAAFQPEPTAVAAARRFVRETLNSWQLPCRDDLVSDAVLLTSELVTNAVVHAGTAVQVACRLHGADVEVSVLDRHPARMIPDPPSGSAGRPDQRPRAAAAGGALVVMGSDIRGGRPRWSGSGSGCAPGPTAPPPSTRLSSQGGHSNGFDPGASVSPAVWRGGAERFKGGYHELLGQGNWPTQWWLMRRTP